MSLSKEIGNNLEGDLSKGLSDGVGEGLEDWAKEMMAVSKDPARMARLKEEDPELAQALEEMAASGEFDLKE